ncbi:uncharacterized protein LOC130648664 [Hydractinia symbiolongicarpus]|uniref:uncharacterized protein LOC130648664 n=1 Tax=Hydractinia symbiolongicarpus TaxID=13093 RepID=UPI00254EDD5B|nr:uncharacterized protein LOC130648664 [Hydractinia symbiolongicarpus]
MNEYPLYRRRDNGIHINVNNVDVDNRWIVPYNPWLSKKHNSHINLEACTSINERNHYEVQTFSDAQYVSAPEALLRLFKLNMHQQSHVVHRLPVHLSNNYIVYFQKGQEKKALDRATDQAAKLTTSFVLNAENRDNRQNMNPDIPLHFVFNKNKVWKPRQRGHCKIVSRTYNHTLGTTAFEDLRAVNGNVAETFRDACLLCGRLQDDTEWNNTLQEAFNFQMLRQLRQLFAVRATHCEPSDPFTLWTRQLPKHIGVAMEAEEVSQLRAQLTDKQTGLANAVIAAVVNVANNVAQNNRLFYLEGAGGSGKTFTYNYLISELTCRGFQVATVAFTGIAATLLKMGTTIHRLLRLPVPIVENNRLLKDVCNNELPFGGKIALLGGDSPQSLPLVRKGKPTEIVGMCLKSSSLMHLVKEFQKRLNDG